MRDEDELLAEALGELAGRGCLGAKFAARFLKTDVQTIDQFLPLAFDLAVEHVRKILADVGRPVDSPWQDVGLARTTLRVLTGGGFRGLNPVVVTVVLTTAGSAGTSVHLRATAKEGLIKQRAGQKTAKRVAELLLDYGA